MKLKSIWFRIGVTIMILIGLFSVLQFSTYYEISSLNTKIKEKDNKVIIEVDSKSNPKFIAYDIFKEDGVYTLKIKVADYYGENWPQTIEIDNIDNIRAIKLSNNEETKLIYPIIN